MTKVLKKDPAVQMDNPIVKIKIVVYSDEIGASPK